MLYRRLAFAGVFTAGALAAPSPAGPAAAGSLVLDESAVQSGSFQTGVGDIGSDAGQAASLTSTDNFINFCAGKTLTNGLQLVGGSCNGIVMGDIPAKTNMVSSIITFPEPGDTIPSDTDFNITVQVANLVAGSFSDADTTYYTSPQTLSGGNIVGHTHVTVQNLGSSLSPKAALDPTQFAFFKGINDAGNGQGLLTAVVAGGLPAGNYRVCTMASATNHQPVLMPVAQRGSQDDCTKFVVTGDGTTINVAANDGSKGIAAAAAVSEAAEAFKTGGIAAELLPSTTVDTSTSVAATSSATAGTGKAGGSGGEKEVSSAVETTDAARATNKVGGGSFGGGSFGGGSFGGGKVGGGAKAFTSIASTTALATGTGTGTTSAFATGSAIASGKAGTGFYGGKHFGGKFGGRRKHRFAHRQFVA